MSKLILHLEGLAVLFLSIYFYWTNDFSWILFIILLFVPDLSMLGYLMNNKIGAVIYNIFHTYIFPIVLIFISLIADQSTFLAIGLIWAAHIGMDRLVGYGLKNPTEFKDTHFTRV